MPLPTDPQLLAEQVREHMFAADTASQGLGMRILTIGPGRATLCMTVRGDMLNGLQTCHGGLIATLADSAFAFACNAGNEATVASGFSIDLLAPARAGDVLTATATEQHRARRTGVYDVEVVNQHGERIAIFRGRSYALQGRSVLPADA